MEGRNRKLNRWPGYDYSQSGLYFITICTHQRIECFGYVKNGEMVLNEYGKIADNFWREIPHHYDNVIIDIHQIMPNHMHGIIGIVGTEHRSVPSANGGLIQPHGKINRPTDDRTEQCSVRTGMGADSGNDRYGLLSKIVKSYKEMAVKTIHKQIGNYEFAWQRSFHDRVIRNDGEFERTHVYIARNPSQWEFDRHNTNNK